MLRLDIEVPILSTAISRGINLCYQQSLLPGVPLITLEGIQIYRS